MATNKKIHPAQVSLRSLRAKVTKARAANESAQATAREARILSALPAYLAVQGGRVGGVEGISDETPTWGTKAEFAKDLGTSPSNLTGLVRLGHALALGFDPNGKDAEGWKVLSTKVNNSPTIRQTLDDPSATLAQVRKAVKVGASEKSGRQVTTNPGDGDTGTEGSGGNENGRTEGTKAPSAKDVMDSLRILFAGDLKDEKVAAKVCKAAHDVLAVAMPALGAEAFSTLENRHSRIMSREVSRRAGATPATVAEVVAATEKRAS